MLAARLRGLLVLENIGEEWKLALELSRGQERHMCGHGPDCSQLRCLQRDMSISIENGERHQRDEVIVLTMKAMEIYYQVLR